MDIINREALSDLSIQDLLEVPVDQIEDAAGFALPPKGAYVLNVACELSTVGGDDNKREAIVMEYEIVETVELQQDSDTPLEAGTKFGSAFMGGQGVQYFKTDYKDVGIALEASTVGELIAAVNGTKVAAVIGHRKDKNDPEKKYPQISNIALV